MSIGMDLLLCAVDSRNGHTRFGPTLSYALPVAEMAHLVHAGRVRLYGNDLVIRDPEPTGEPLTDSALALLRLPGKDPPTVQNWVARRGPRRIDRYVEAAAEAGIVKVVTARQSGLKMLTVVDPEPINQVTRRLIAVLDDPAPGFEDMAFAVLADTAGIARPHLNGWGQRGRRARLSALGRSTADDNAARLLRKGRKAIMELSRSASRSASHSGFPSTIDQQIGLTRDGVAASALFWP